MRRSAGAMLIDDMRNEHGASAVEYCVLLGMIAAVIIFVLGWIVGSIVMGVYLFISLNIFKRHSNEAFSALACPDWKNFLRLRIDAQGGLTIFPIGIRRVARKWKTTGASDGPGYVSDDSKATPPELIEQPISI